MCVQCGGKMLSSCFMLEIYLPDLNETTPLHYKILDCGHTLRIIVFVAPTFSAFLFIIISTKNKIMSFRGTHTTFKM